MNDIQLKSRSKPPVYLPMSQWEELIKEHKVSGKSLEQFCNEKGVSKSAFTSNRNKLRGSDFIKVPLVKNDIGVFELKANIFGFKLSIELVR